MSLNVFQLNKFSEHNCYSREHVCRFPMSEIANHSFWVATAKCPLTMMPYGLYVLPQGSILVSFLTSWVKSATHSRRLSLFAVIFFDLLNNGILFKEVGG